MIVTSLQYPANLLSVFHTTSRIFFTAVPDIQPDAYSNPIYWKLSIP